MPEPSSLTREQIQFMFRVLLEQHELPPLTPANLRELQSLALRTESAELENESLRERVMELEKLSSAISRDCNETALQRNELSGKLTAALERAERAERERKQAEDDASDHMMRRLAAERALAAAREALQVTVDALSGLRTQVETFCNAHGEWDFYTGDATKALTAARAALNTQKEKDRG